MSELELSFDRPVSAEALARLLAQTAWGADRTVDDLTVALGHSLLNLGAWRGDELVGFVRALGDDRYRVLVEDVVVDAAERGNGVGTAMMRALLARLAHVEEVNLACAPQTVPFYARLGFTPAPGAHLTLRRVT